MFLFTLSGIVFFLPLIAKLNQDSQSPMTTEWNSRHCKISVTQRSSGESLRQGKRQFMIYAEQLCTCPNDSQATLAQSPWRRCRPTPLHIFEAETINHLYSMVQRNGSKSTGSSGPLERFQGPKWDFLVSCLTHAMFFIRDERACDWNVGVFDQRKSILFNVSQLSFYLNILN